jgi:cytochrome oxidase assembly protein ShyY1
VKRIPIFSTIIVALAVAAMIALGFWQIHRLHEKEALLARYTTNIKAPPIAFPRVAQGDDLLFRKASAFCLQPVSFDKQGAGGFGFRVIAHCKTGAEGPGFAVQLGTSQNPDVQTNWKGGNVSGYIIHAPDHRPLIALMFGNHTPPPLMLVAATPPAGLAANPGPDLSTIPNNHLSYAVQWFLFAAIALIIYTVALRKRMRGA